MDNSINIDIIIRESNSCALPFPYPGNWALSTNSCQFLATLVRHIKPERVIEFGSGYSSLIVGEELRKKGSGVLHSIDNSRTWNRRAKDEAAKHPRLAQHIQFYRFPLGMRIYGSQPVIGFKIPASFYFSPQPYDMVVIDAPHVDVNRDSVLYEIFPHVKLGGFLFCDDCNASYMQWTLKRWEERYPDSFDIRLYPDIGNGIGIIIKKTEGDGGPLFRPAQFVPSVVRGLRNYYRIGKLHLND